MYFECIIGNGGGGTEIPLIVNCSSSFAGKTITCTDGTTTLTDVCPNTSPYTVVFSLPNDGSWDVSGVIGGVTISETILISAYEVDLIDFTDITVTVYGAVNDTVSYTGLDGATHTITLNSSGSASATVKVYSQGNTTLTFSSTIAKDASDLSKSYTKDITFTPATTEIYVMPDGALYWYGYIKSGLGSFSRSGYTLYGTALAGGTAETNKLNIPTASTNTYRGVGSDNAFTIENKYTKLKAHFDASGNGIQFGLVNSKTVNGTTTTFAYCQQSTSGNAIIENTIQSYGNAYAFYYAGNSQQYGDCYALWLE